MLGVKRRAFCRYRCLQTLRVVQDDGRRGASHLSGCHCSYDQPLKHDLRSHNPLVKRSVPIQQPLRSVEDDFVQRLLVGRLSGPIDGPYSRLRDPRRPCRFKSLANEVSNERIIPKTRSHSALNGSQAASVPHNPMPHAHTNRCLPSQLIPLRRGPLTQSLQLTRENDADPSTKSVQRHGVSRQSRARNAINNTALTPSPEDPASTPEQESLLSDVESEHLTRAELCPTSAPMLDIPSQSGTEIIQLGDTSPQPNTKVAPVFTGNEYSDTRSVSPNDGMIANLDSVHGARQHGSYWANNFENKNKHTGNLNEITVRQIKPSHGVGVKTGPIQTTGRANTNKPPRAITSLYEEKQAIQELEDFVLDPNYSVADSWENYLKLGKRAAQERHSIPRETQAAMFEKMLSSWYEETNCAIILAPSAVLQRIFPSKTLDVALWGRILWAVLLKAMASLRSNVSTLSSVATYHLLLEVKVLWDLALTGIPSHRKLLAKGERHCSPSVTWDILVQSNQMQQIRMWFNKSFNPRLRAFFPTMGFKQFKDFESAALISFAILHAHSETMGIDSTPFQRFIAHLLPYTDLQAHVEQHISAFASHGASNDDNAYVRHLLNQVAAVEISIHISIATQLAYHRDDESSRIPALSSQHQLEDFWKKRIARTIEGQNIVRLDTIWREACTSSGSPHSKGQKTVTTGPVFGAFLTAFMALRRPNRAIDVWNVMINNGIEPTVAVWDAMLKGCGISKDASALHEIWVKMLMSGIKPDAQVWATRIHSATISGHWWYGIEAFREMTSAWVEQVKRSYPDHPGVDLKELGDLEGVPKPNTQTLNGLIVGLSRSRKHDELVNILRLARTLGIKADSYTFNPIIRTAISSGNTSLAVQLLEQMQYLDIKPDVATFTMMLQALLQRESLEASPDSSFKRVGSLSEGITEMLQSMQRNGLQSNAWTFATLINGLLKGPNGGNIVAAYAVVDYMVAKQIPLSSQIFTTLLTYHFNQETGPDLAAVEALWNRARMESAVHLDIYFYDRLIEGFAKCNETGRMMAALSHAGKRGKTPGWPAMTEVILALCRSGDPARAAEIIATVREEDLLQDNPRHEKGKAFFWQVVHETGLEHNLSTAIA